LDNVGLDNVGLDNVGLDNVGLDNVGLDNVGLDNVGLDNVGLDAAMCLDGLAIVVGSATLPTDLAANAFFTVVRLLIKDFFWTDIWFLLKEWILSSTAHHCLSTDHAKRPEVLGPPSCSAKSMSYESRDGKPQVESGRISGGLVKN
jgi:hypothetical protein